MKEKFLEISNVSKTFPGVKALDKVKFDIYPGEVHALVGENGAGKSTLIKILSGVQPPDDGAKIVIGGEETVLHDPMDAIKKGIQGRVSVEFIIDKDGSVIDAEVTKSVDPLLDAEALRVVNASPKWKPAKVKGVTVRSSVSIPIEFKLEKKGKFSFGIKK